MLASGSVQEVMDLGGIAHLSAIKGRVPFLHFFDGFRTSHEVQKIEVFSYEDYKKLIDWDAVQKFRDNALNPEHPVIRGTAQNPDIFFQGREASNKFYEAIPEIVVDYMNKVSELTGRSYKPFDYVGAPDAERIIVAMGSVCETIEETINHMNAQGRKSRPHKGKTLQTFREGVLHERAAWIGKKIAVLDRTKEPGSLGEPLYQDVKTLLFDEDDAPKVYGGRYGSWLQRH